MRNRFRLLGLLLLMIAYAALMLSQVKGAGQPFGTVKQAAFVSTETPQPLEQTAQARTATSIFVTLKAQATLITGLLTQTAQAKMATPMQPPNLLNMTATALIGLITETVQAQTATPYSLTLQARATTVIGLITQTAQAKTGAIMDYSKLPQTVTKDNSPVLGNADASIFLLLFEDFSCPHCREYSPTIEQVIESYVRTEKARLEVHLMTFVGGPLSETAALAALCADPQNRFWDMRPALYSLAEQEGPKAFTAERVTTIAKQLDLDISACLSAKQTLPTLETDKQLFNDLNLNGVPSLLYSTDGGKTWKQFVDDGGKQTGQPTIAIIQKTLDAAR